ncbi:uncharacterized protein LOC134223119 [Armigeres subalbatus]|uniref:uncharacterized protein LOC134223119 n=1 Tax=Armigeres subalbatus TaxID=124917 RepID=UPI002ED0F341
MAEKKMKQKELKRRNIMDSIKRIEEFLDNYNQEQDSQQVAIRLSRLDKLMDTFEDIQGEYETFDESDEFVKHNMGVRAKVEEQFFRVKGGLTSLMPSVAPTPAQVVAPVPAISHSIGVKLPTITLPQFDGDLNEWLTFHDSFSSLIHSSADIPCIQKFQYLRSALKGDALRLIETLTITAANYSVAWQSLLNRYANKYLLKKKHLQAITHQPKMLAKSASKLCVVVEEFQRHVKILEQLGEPTTQWSSLLVHLLCSRVDEQSLKDWEEFMSAGNDPTYANLIEFLNKKIRTFESLSITAVQFALSPQNKHNPPSKQSRSSQGPSSSQINSYAATENYLPNCHACNQQHLLVKCPVFEKMPLKDRLNVVNAKKICSNCFRGDHFVRKCASKFSCRVCQKRHHTLLHPGFEPLTNNNGNINLSQGHRQGSTSNAARCEVEAIGAQTETSISSNSVSDPRSVNVFLSTVVLIIIDGYGREHLARALLDSGSQCCLMSERLCQQLRLVRRRINQPIFGVGESQVRAVGSASTEIRSRLEEFSVPMECLILRNITTSLPAVTIPKNNCFIPEGIDLADPDYNVSRRIDLIIGAEHFYTFLKGGRMNLGESSPTLVESVFGWLVSGKSSYAPIPHPPLCHISTLESLDRNIEKFWRIEEVDTKVLSPIEQHCENFYKSTVSRDPSGRYVVKYPKKDGFSHMLGESYTNAVRRLEGLERKLERNELLKERYHTFMSEFVNLGHMREISLDEEASSVACFLPHHPVVKEASMTTKVRGVFDASAKTSTGYSLNDGLLTGPVLQDELYLIILRFRRYKVVLLADIEKMYRMVRIHPDDQPLQCVLFRFSKVAPITKYVLTTVTYGLSPSSFLATRTLYQLAEDEGSSYPLAADALKQDFYMDDFIRGENSVDSAIQLRRQMTELLHRGGFRLRKWCSNFQEVLDGVPEEDLAAQSNRTFDPDETIKTLGLSWEPLTDQFRFDVNIGMKQSKITKRIILSEISRLYDPLGLIAPIVVRAKIIMQQLWMLSLEWDEEVPTDIQTKWATFVKELSSLSKFRIDRYAFEVGVVQLHCFADASDDAYGACIYVRTADTHGYVKTELLTAKSRVAPLKKRSIPRLELCAAQIAAHLTSKVRATLAIEADSVWYWSDSMVVLHWLQSPPQTWKTFVSNRVADVQILTHGSKWRHVSGTENPADLLSRGMAVEKFTSSELWRHGPSWLRKEQHLWPEQNAILTDQGTDELLERRINSLVVQTTSPPNPIITRFSSYHRLTRTIAYCFRFVNNVREKEKRNTDILSTEELEHSKTCLIKMVQAECYKDELQALKKGKSVANRSTLKLLNPTKAVHIELVGDLSSSSFLSALRRFIARRGLPEHIYSDNATNFAGAKHELHALYQMLKNQTENARIATSLATNGIKWHMIPPRAPNFGGLWEAAVKVAKKHLVRQIGTSSLLQEDLQTVLAQIESCMNSRPLVALSDDPNDLEALTPGHFLVGSNLQALPEPDLRNLPTNRLDRYECAQQKVQHFWSRWTSEYLKELQHQATINPRKVSLKIGQIVVLQDQQLPMLRWPLARIMQLHPGQDGVVRVVTVRTASGIFKRPTSKVCLLPPEMEDGEENLAAK